MFVRPRGPCRKSQRQRGRERRKGGGRKIERETKKGNTEDGRPDTNREAMEAMEAMHNVGVHLIVSMSSKVATLFRVSGFIV